MRDRFMVPPKHINFEAKKLFGEMVQIIDGAIAYINLKGAVRQSSTPTSTTICLLL